MPRHERAVPLSRALDLETRVIDLFSIIRGYEKETEIRCQRNQMTRLLMSSIILLFEFQTRL